MKRRIICFFMVFILMFTVNSNCASEDVIKEQKNTFEINSFIKNAKEYVDGELFKQDDLDDIFESAITGKVNNKNFFDKMVNIFAKEFKETLISMSSILVIIVIHSILKSISESLENSNISKLIYYVQYILIATIVMTNFSGIIEIVKNSTTNMVGFINLLIPLLTSLMIFTGSITTTNMLQPAILFGVNLIGNLIQNILIPVVMIISSFTIISKISDKVQLDKLQKYLKSGIIWVLGIVLTIFIATISLEGTLSTSVDGITAKTTKAIVSSAIPIVGKILGDAVDSILGCGIILKNAVGIVGIIVILGLCIVPVLKLAILAISYKILTGICEPIADEKIIKLLEQIGDIFKILLAILSSVAVLIIIGVTLVINISNSGMMYK